MNKLLLALVMLLVFAAPVQAESLKVGTQSISYDTPKGYVLAMDGLYAEIINILKQAMPPDMKIHAMYVSKEADKIFRNDPEAGLNDYLMITSSSQLDSQMLSDDDFKEFKDYLNKNHGKLTGSSMQKKVNESLSGIADGAIKIGSMKSLGTFDESKTSISYMALVTQIVNMGGQQTAVEQGMISTSKLVKGKMLVINQYRVINSEDEVNKFQGEAAKIIKSMDFDEGGVSSSKSTVSKRKSSSSGGSYIGRGIMGAILGGLIGAGVMYYRKKKHGTAGNPRADKMVNNIDNLKNQASEKLGGMFKKKDK